jgi:hydrogenase maturation protein HypF
MELEMIMNSASDSAGYSFQISKDSEKRIIRLEPLWEAILGDIKEGVPNAEISLRFHRGVVGCFTELCRQLRDETGIGSVALSGGCFQNRFLLSELSRHLEASQFKVVTHTHVPCNDGGIALGQAVIGSSHLS